MLNTPGQLSCVKLTAAGTEPSAVVQFCNLMWEQVGRISSSLCVVQTENQCLETSRQTAAALEKAVVCVSLCVAMQPTGNMQGKKH